MNLYCRNLLNLYRFGNRNPQRIFDGIIKINRAKQAEITRHLSTSSKCLIGKWVWMNDDGWQDINMRPVFVVMPNVPKETTENNLLLESIEFNRDWPPLYSTTPEEFYQGTLKLLMELCTTYAELIDTLEEELNKKKITFPFTFDSVISAPLKERNIVFYAYNTLYLKMLTDWPQSEAMDWHKDYYAIAQVAHEELNARMFIDIIVEAVKKIPQSELDKLDPWKQRFIDYYKKEYLMAGYEQDTIKNKRDRKQQDLNMHLLFTEIQRHFILFYMCVLSEQETSLVNVTITDRDQIKNAPPKVLQLLAGDNNPETGPWSAKTIDGTIFEMLKYSSARQQKQKLWEAWISKGSLTTDENLINNSPIIHVIRNLLQRLTEHLGFRSIPHMQLNHKMIGNPETLREFIASLYHRFRPVFIQRYDDWKNYADEEEGIPIGQLRPFDMFYICRREAEFYHGVDTIELMKYFPSWQTFENLLKVTEKFLGIQFVDITHENNNSMERCHPSCRIFRVTDLNTNKMLGRVYIDPFVRPGKLANSWKTNLWRMENNEKCWDKLIWMIGNMPEMDAKNQSLLHYESITEMLNAFGRTLQYLISESPYEILILPHKAMAHEWDALNFMPTFVSFFINKPEFLLAMSSPHVETGQELSLHKATDISLALARGMFWDMWRTLFWTDFDLTLYEVESADDKHYLDLYKEMYQEYFPFPREPNNYQPCSFIPIFGSRTAPCSYYQQLWNEALALDVHETFYKEGNYLKTSARLNQKWLKNGALKSQWDMYKEFQGREPNIMAMGNFYDPQSYYSLKEQEKDRRKVAQIA